MRRSATLPAVISLVAASALAAPISAAPALPDIGVFADLTPRVRLPVPAGLDPAGTVLVVDRARALVIVTHRGWPVAAVPTGGPARVELGGDVVGVAADAQAALARVARGGRVVLTGTAGAPTWRDRDADGLPDPLDVLVGAKKLVLNGADYIEGYEKLAYPGGDVARERGVCTDTVIRALRNAGLDLQQALYEDIGRSPKAYPMVKRRNPSINHRRVKTLLPFFRRHLERHTAALDDPDDPVRPGDILFFDTFPSRKGPDHVGIVSDRRGPSGHLLVINNWAPGHEDAEMDLLGSVPVTDRFRLPLVGEPGRTTRR